MASARRIVAKIAVKLAESTGKAFGDAGKAFADLRKAIKGK